MQSRAPATAATLAPPASDEHLRAVERATGLTLPRDLSDSLRIHNGQMDSTRLYSFTHCWLLLQTSEIVDTWRTYCDVQARV